MKKDYEYHLFIVWEAARYKEDFILKDIAKQFEIIYQIEVGWSHKYFSDNLTRFYGVNLPSGSEKEKHIGVGKFLTVIVRDYNYSYGTHETSNGNKYINSKTFLAKSRYREVTGGGHKVHGTNTPEEFSHDFALLFGCTIDEFMLKHKPSSSRSIKHSDDVVGYSGWSSLEQVFHILNQTHNYVVMRNFSPLPDGYYANEHGDIDFLVRDYEAVRYVLNAQPVFPEGHRVHNRIVVGEDEVLLDLRYVGDGYYDTAWQEDILNNSTEYRSIRVMDDENHFYSLLYHALIHKPEVAQDYIDTLSLLNKKIQATRSKINRDWISSDEACNHLAGFLSGKGYVITEPEPSVYINRDVVEKIRNTQDRLAQVSYLGNEFKLGVIEEFKVGPHRDERRYYKATRGDKEYFIKSGSRSYKHEYDMAKLAYDKNNKLFAEPVEFREGETNYYITEWLDGVGLDVFLDKNKPTKKQKEILIRDLSEIYKVLKGLGIVHRDLIPRNFIVSNGSLVLIDFYWAVRYADYEEYDYVENDIAILGLLGEEFSSDRYLWDDAFSMVKIAELICGDDKTLINSPSVTRMRDDIGKVEISPNHASVKKLAALKQQALEKNLELQSEIRQQNEKRASLEQEIDALRMTVGDLSHGISLIKKSLSWRATKPLRFTTRVARGALKALGLR